MVLVQNWPLFLFFVLDKIGQENLCCDILIGKNPFLAIETRQWAELKVGRRGRRHPFSFEILHYFYRIPSQIHKKYLE